LHPVTFGEIRAESRVHPDVFTGLMFSAHHRDRRYKRCEKNTSAVQRKLEVRWCHWWCYYSPGFL